MTVTYLYEYKRGKYFITIDCIHTEDESCDNPMCFEFNDLKKKFEFTGHHEYNIMYNKLLIYKTLREKVNV